MRSIMSTRVGFASAVSPKSVLGRAAATRPARGWGRPSRRALASILAQRLGPALVPGFSLSRTLRAAPEIGLAQHDAVEVATRRDGGASRSLRRWGRSPARTPGL